MLRRKHPFVDVLSHDKENYRKGINVFFSVCAQFRGRQRIFAGFCSPRSTFPQNQKMLSTMRQVCCTSARCLRPVMSSTSVLTRNTHQAKAQAPSTTGSPSSGDYDLKLVNGKKTFSFTHHNWNFLLRGCFFIV